MKPTYLDGVKECEEFYQAGYTFTELIDYLERETLLVDYRWSDWVEGFTDGIEHFERLEELNNA